MWNFTWDFSYVKFHMWKVTWDIPHMKSRTWFICAILCVTHLMWNLTCEISQVEFLMVWEVTFEIFLILDFSHFKFPMCFSPWDFSHVKFHMWLLLLFTYEISNAIFHMRKISCGKCHVKFHTCEITNYTCHMWNFTCEISRVKNMSQVNFTCKILHMKYMSHGKHMGSGIHLGFLNFT